MLGQHPKDFAYNISLCNLSSSASLMLKCTLYLVLRVTYERIIWPGFQRSSRGSIQVMYYPWLGAFLCAKHANDYLVQISLCIVFLTLHTHKIDVWTPKLVSHSWLEYRRGRSASYVALPVRHYRSVCDIIGDLASTFSAVCRSYIF